MNEFESMYQDLHHHSFSYNCGRKQFDMQNFPTSEQTVVQCEQYLCDHTAKFTEN